METDLHCALVHDTTPVTIFALSSCNGTPLDEASRLLKDHYHSSKTKIIPAFLTCHATDIIDHDPSIRNSSISITLRAGNASSWNDPNSMLIALSPPISTLKSIAHSIGTLNSQFDCLPRINGSSSLEPPPPATAFQPPPPLSVRHEPVCAPVPLLATPPRACELPVDAMDVDVPPPIRRKPRVIDDGDDCLPESNPSVDSIFDDDDHSSTAKPPVATTTTPIKRKRRRVKKPHTYMDNRGRLVTEDIVVSEEYSDDDVTLHVPAKLPAHPIRNNTPPTTTTKAKPSSSKTSKQRTMKHQTSIKSFFTSSQK